MNLIGDAIHNFIDGLIIASTFFTSFSLGIITSITVLVHEIPQEIGDFGVLIHGGFSKLKALKLNLLSALSSILGVVLSWYLSQQIESLNHFLLPFAAGGFIYIAAADLIPELKHNKNQLKIIIALGLGIIFTSLFNSH
jgi:zinc and cadmium transporter